MAVTEFNRKWHGYRAESVSDEWGVGGSQANKEGGLARRQLPTAPAKMVALEITRANEAVARPDRASRHTRPEDRSSKEQGPENQGDVMGGSGSQTDRNSLDQRPPATFDHPVHKKYGNVVQVKSGRSNRGKLSGLINQKREGSQKNAAERGIAGFPLFHPNSREPEHPNRQQEDSNQLHQHVPHRQPNNIRQQRDPLVG